MSAESKAISEELAAELEKYNRKYQDAHNIFLKNFDEIIKQVDEATSNKDLDRLRELAYQYLYRDHDFTFLQAENIYEGHEYSVNPLISGVLELLQRRFVNNDHEVFIRRSNPERFYFELEKKTRKRGYKLTELESSLLKKPHVQEEIKRVQNILYFDTYIKEIGKQIKEYLNRVQRRLINRPSEPLKIKTNGVPHYHEATSNVSPTSIVRIHCGTGLQFLLNFLLKERIGKENFLSNYDNDFGMCRTRGIKVVAGNDPLDSKIQKSLLVEAREHATKTLDYPVIFSADVEAQYLLQASGSTFWLRDGPKGEDYVLPFNSIGHLKNISLCIVTQCMRDYPGSDFNKLFVDLPPLDLQMKVYNLLKSYNVQDPLSFLEELDPKYTTAFSKHLRLENQRMLALAPVDAPISAPVAVQSNPDLSFSSSSSSSSSSPSWSPTLAFQSASTNSLKRDRDDKPSTASSDFGTSLGEQSEESANESEVDENPNSVKGSDTKKHKAKR